MGCVYIFTRRHIWSFKRCLERMYDLNVTMQHQGSLRIISSNTYSLDRGGILEIRCEYDCQHHHKGGYWTCELRFIRNLESLTVWRILLQAVGQKWVFLRACFLRWWATLRHVHIQGRNTTTKTMTCNYWYHHSQLLQRSQVYTWLFSHVPVKYLVRFIFYFIYYIIIYLELGIS